MASGIASLPVEILLQVFKGQNLNTITALCHTTSGFRKIIREHASTAFWSSAKSTLLPDIRTAMRLWMLVHDGQCPAGGPTMHHFCELESCLSNYQPSNETTFRVMVQIPRLMRVTDVVLRRKLVRLSRHFKGLPQSTESIFRASPTPPDAVEVQRALLDMMSVQMLLECDPEQEPQLASVLNASAFQQHKIDHFSAAYLELKQNGTEHEIIACNRWSQLPFPSGDDGHQHSKVHNHNFKFLARYITGEEAEPYKLSMIVDFGFAFWSKQRMDIELGLPSFSPPFRAEDWAQLTQRWKSLCLAEKAHLMARGLTALEDPRINREDSREGTRR